MTLSEPTVVSPLWWGQTSAKQAHEALLDRLHFPHPTCILLHLLLRQQAMGIRGKLSVKYLAFERACLVTKYRGASKAGKGEQAENQGQQTDPAKFRH